MSVVKVYFFAGFLHGIIHVFCKTGREGHLHLEGQLDFMTLATDIIEQRESSWLSEGGGLESLFRCPPTAYGPVPFYWWAGERLDRGRIAWQLDQLCAKGVRQTIVSYPHHPDGTSNLGDPELFSAEWWDLFRWFLSACRERGMTAGFQDYTLVEPILKSIGRDTPGMQGGRMSCVSEGVSGNAKLSLTAEKGAIVIGAWAYQIEQGLPVPSTVISLSDKIIDGSLEWSSAAGEWFVALVFARPNEFDPLHPSSGDLAIDRLYAPFERECPDELGKTLNLFFQDELSFGSKMPFWSNHLLESFRVLKGYDLAPLLPALWHDLGEITEKVRLDYSDVVTRRMEECYFKPVFLWHEARGLLFGHDNCGRGWIGEGRAHYGDYFRAMRWFTAPGCDDPKLDGLRAFRGLKVNSSIAHLYRRPRVWVEAFHSSGWGVTPAEIVEAINEDFVYGATVVNLHGLYYSTRGGWWEWAPPDVHFRQPYWEHGQALNDYFTRMCWLLSQGVHRCDVAILYPISALDAEPADPAIAPIVAHVENKSIDGNDQECPGAEDAAFGLGKHLFDHACDFDFLDFESLARSRVGQSKLTVADASYRVLIFPAMKAVRGIMLEKARDFVRSGGLVIAYGCLPNASDVHGRNDPLVRDDLLEIFGSADDSGNRFKEHPGGGRGIFLRSGYTHVLEAISGTIERDVISDEPLQVLHRKLEDREIYLVFNPSKQRITAGIRFRSEGGVERWDPWTGKIEAVSRTGELEISLGAREARILVCHRDVAHVSSAVRGVPVSHRIEALEGPWESRIHPTLDNRYGDFNLPATSGLLGPQARRFRCHDELADESGWEAPGYDDSGWKETTYSFGPQMEYAGPFPPDADLESIEASLIRGEASLDWHPYSFSRRWGIEEDPFLTDWLSGPHGLKGAVPDEFLDFHSETVGSVWYLRAQVVAQEEVDCILVSGGRCGYQIWINGESVSHQPKGMVPGVHAPWNIPHYECDPAETRVRLKNGLNELLVKLVQPAGQRTRAFFAFDPPVMDREALGLRWFGDREMLRPCMMAAPDRRAIRFRLMSPPGLREVLFVSRGRARIWVGGNELNAVPIRPLPAGCISYRALVGDAVDRPQTIAIRVEAPQDSHEGDALPQPVEFVCGAGSILAGDWCEQGLASYSGAVEYRRTFQCSESPTVRAVSLDLGKVSATAEVRLNGRSVATLLAPPWRCELTPFLVPGKNLLSIIVANTLANHYAIGIPTPYAFMNQTPSGLFGPVTLITTS